VSNHCILVATNIAETCDTLCDILKESNFDVLPFSDIMTGLDIAEHAPDLLLLDIDDSGITPSDICQKLNAISHDGVPIIIISSAHSAEDEIEFYNAGINQHIERPFSDKNLQRWVNTCLVNQKKINQLTESHNESMNMAKATIANSSEMGIALRFIQDCFQCVEHEEIAELAFQALDSYGLDYSLMLIEMGEPEFYFQDDIELPIEKKALLGAHGKIPIFEFKGRIIFNAPHLTLLIKNLPNDEEKIDRLKEHLTILVDSIDARAGSIDSEIELQNKQDILTNIVRLATNSIEEINQQHSQLELMHSEVMCELVVKLEESYLHLGLEPRQEAFLSELVTETEKNTKTLFQSGMNLDVEFHKIIDQVNKVLAETKKVKFGH
jgi:DNA-binding response OmpR family regulator